MKAQRRRRSRPTGTEIFDRYEEQWRRSSGSFQFSMLDLDSTAEAVTLENHEIEVPPGSPDWIEMDLIEDTIRACHLRSGTIVDSKYAVSLLLSMAKLLDLEVFTKGEEQ